MRTLISRFFFVTPMMWLLVAQLAPSLTASSEQEQRKQVDDPDEYAVYNAVLKARYLDDRVKRYVIALKTTSAAKTAFIGYRHGLAPSGAKRPEVNTETSMDFDIKDKDSCELLNKFSLPIPYFLVSEATMRKLFDKEDDNPSEDGWNRFYKEYPGAPGAISFTRVGFNKKKDQALLYVARQGGFVGGSSVFFVISRGGDAWKIEKEVILWLS